MSDNNDFDVIIVGLGPVGAMLANLLGRLHLKVLVLEKNKEVHPSPRAIHFDGEVMRIFQNAGLDGKIRKIARPTHKGMHFIGANNKTLLVRKGVKGIGDQGWENNWYFFQPDLERELRFGLQQYPNVTVRLGEEVVYVANSGLQIQVKTMSECNENKSHYMGNWLVGCDGAKSLVSKNVSTDVEDLGLDEKWLVIDLKIREGSKRAANLADYTIQHCKPERPMTQCYISPLRRRWEIMVFPDDHTDEMIQEQFIWFILNPWLGPEDAVIERAQIYTFHSILKRQWKNGRIVLAGDSAHQSPPFLGQGLCAGLRDVSALAWRLSLVVEGRASSRTINSYEHERKSHVRKFIELAISCGEIIKSGNSSLITNYFKHDHKEEKAVFDFPKPQLGSGDWIFGDPPLGQICPQFVDSDHSLSDNYALYQFILFLNLKLKRKLCEKSLKIIQDWDIIVVEAAEAAKTWLHSIGSSAALVRPDRYLYGVAKNPQEVFLVLSHFQRSMNEV